MHRKLIVLFAALALALFGLSACGDDDDGDTDTAATTTEATTTDDTTAAGDGGSSTFEIAADAGGALAYDVTKATVDAGSVEIVFDNPASVPHDVVIEGDDGDIGGTDVITESSTEATVDLEPGKYTFYCSVPGHREAGMEGTLTVK